MRTTKSRLSPRKFRRREAGEPVIVIPASDTPPLSQEEGAPSPTPEHRIPWWKQELSDQDMIALALGLVALAAILLPSITGLVTILTSPK